MDRRHDPLPLHLAPDPLASRIAAMLIAVGLVLAGAVAGLILLLGG